MLKELKAKLPISLSLTRQLVVGVIKEAAESGVLTSDSKLSLSLKCPLGKSQMVTPCRGVHCDHVLCFDALNFLQTYEKVNISKWTCPVCDSHLDYEDLRVDSFFDVIVSSIGEDSKDYNVKIDASGNFSVDSTTATVSECQPSETIALVDDEGDELDEDVIQILSSEDESDNFRVQSKNKRTIDIIDSSSDDGVEFGEYGLTSQSGSSKRTVIQNKTDDQKYLGKREAQ